METDLITNIDQIRISGYRELTVRGKAFYREKCKELIRDGELRKSHLQTLLLWADHYDRYWKLRKDVEAEGETYIAHNRQGEELIKSNPKVEMRDKAEAKASKLLAEFGATLRQSRRLGKEKTPPKSDLDKFMEGLNGGSKA